MGYTKSLKCGSCGKTFKTDRALKKHTCELPSTIDNVISVIAANVRYASMPNQKEGG